MDDINEMKRMWLDLNQRFSALEEENRSLAQKIVNGKLKTVQEKLIKKYTLFIMLGILMIVYIFLFFLNNPMMIEKYKWITLSYWTAFFLFEISIDLYLRKQLKDIDIYNSSVKEISARATKNWKIHKLAVAIGLPLAFGAIILLGFSMNANKYLFLGMIVGVIIGLSIGLLQLKKFYKNYRRLQGIDE